MTYYPARTRPFDLVPLYQQLIAGASDDIVVGELRQVRYTEGYPYLLALSVALWLASSPLGLPAMRNLFLLILSVAWLRSADRGRWRGGVSSQVQAGE